MGLRVVGAGVGRTGTTSLQAALQQLLGEPCYHMGEVFSHMEHVPLWQEAVDTGTTRWDDMFDGYAAAVDWPASAFYAELMALHPDAVVLLSTRDSDSWWKSVSTTILSPAVWASDRMPADWRHMLQTMLATRFTDAVDDPVAMKAAFERHNATVREVVPAERLLDWNVRDGWEPICAALDVAVPDAPFPHANSTEDFLAMLVG